MASLEWIDPYLSANSRILDLGGCSVFTDALREFHDVRVRANAVPDLRYKFPFDDNAFDLVLCMEVIEHVCDRGDSRVDIFTGSGIKNVMSESFRVLRSGGHLFLTTPNVCCYNSIWNILCGKHPFSYQPHFRELAVHDVITYVEQSGFEFERHDVLDTWKGHNVSDDVVDKVDELSASLGVDAPRGDCTFILAHKV